MIILLLLATANRILALIVYPTGKSRWCKASRKPNSSSSLTFNVFFSIKISFTESRSSWLKNVNQVNMIKQQFYSCESNKLESCKFNINAGYVAQSNGFLFFIFILPFLIFTVLYLYCPVYDDRHYTPYSQLHTSKTTGHHTSYLSNLHLCHSYPKCPNADTSTI